MAASIPTLRLDSLTEDMIPRLIEIERASEAVPWSEQSMRNELDHDHGLFRVALVEGQVVGFVCAWMVVDELHITNFAVDPEFRRLGIATRLLKDVMHTGAENGMKLATLEVRESNIPALTLYEKAGFVKEGVRKRYYPDNREDAVVMWKDSMP